jgi:hypothetical protein
MPKKREIAPHMLKRASLLFFVILALSKLSAQTTHTQETWLDFLNQNRYSDKWGSWLDVQLKLIDGYTHEKNAGEYTAGASYFVNRNYKFTAAFTYVDAYPNNSHVNHTAELRPWAMVQLNTSNHYSKWLQWIRVEERFKETIQNQLGTGNFDESTRLRYYVLAQFPLTKHKYEKGSISFVTSEELYLNFGKNIVYNTFDQNRLFLGFYYYLNKENILQLGYTSMYQKYNAPNKYLLSDVLRVSIFNNIDFRHH